MFSSIKTFLKRCLYKHSLAASQAGQDFWVYAEAFNEKKGGYFLDIGAHDGLTLSNTYILESRYSWSGICVEANPITYKSLKKNRRSTCLNICLDREAGTVDFTLRSVMGGIVDEDVDNNTAKAKKRGEVIQLPTFRLDSVLEKQQAPKVIDYLSIDVEGAEERILADFDFNQYTFRCITIERPSEKLRNILQNNGYCLVRELQGLDCYYVHRDFFEDYSRNQLLFYRKKYLSVRWR